MCVDKPLKQGKYVIADATKIAMGQNGYEQFNPIARFRKRPIPLC